MTEQSPRSWDDMMVAIEAPEIAVTVNGEVHGLGSYLAAMEARIIAAIKAGGTSDAHPG